LASATSQSPCGCFTARCVFAQIACAPADLYRGNVAQQAHIVKAKSIATRFFAFGQALSAKP